MSETQENSNFTHEDVLNLQEGKVLFEGEYSFQNPYSINGPFGNFMLVLGEGQVAFGNIAARTLWGLGTTTEGSFSGTYQFDASSGYTNVVATGYAAINAPFRQPVWTRINLSISISPDKTEGTVSLQGFPMGGSLKCKLTKQIYPSK